MRRGLRMRGPSLAGGRNKGRGWVGGEGGIEKTGWSRGNQEGNQPINPNTSVVRKLAALCAARDVLLECV